MTTLEWSVIFDAMCNARTIFLNTDLVAYTKLNKRLSLFYGRSKQKLGL